MAVAAVIKRIRPQAQAESAVRVPDLHDWRHRNSSAYVAVHFQSANVAGMMETAAAECRRIGDVLDGDLGRRLKNIATEWNKLSAAAGAFNDSRDVVREMLAEVAAELNTATARQVVSEFQLSEPATDDVEWIARFLGDRGIVFHSRVWHEVLSTRNRLQDVRALLEFNRSGGGEFAARIVRREIGDRLW